MLLLLLMAVLSASELINVKVSHPVGSCSFRLFNGSERDVTEFTVKTEGVPVDLDRQLAREGWSARFGTGSAAVASRTLVPPGARATFDLALLRAHGKIDCSALQWSAQTAKHGPAEKPAPPPKLTTTLRNLTVRVENLTIPIQLFEADVELRNESDQQLIVPLGYRHSGQDIHEWLKLVAHRLDGSRVHLDYYDLHPGGGRVEPLLIMLSPGASRTLHGKWMTFQPLPEGTYRFTAEIQSSSTDIIDNGPPVVRYWWGKFESPPVELAIR